MNKNSQQQELTFIEHLEELRRRLIICFIGVIVGTIIGFGIANSVLFFLTRPFKLSTISDSDSQVLKIQVQPDGTLKLANPSFSEAEKKSLKNTPYIVFEFESADSKSKEKVVVGDNLKQKFYYFSPIDPFLLRLKAALLVGIVISLPLWLWQIWLFIRPALTVKERRSILPVSISALVLFPVGAGFAYFFTRYALVFLARYTFPGLEPRLNVFKYLNFLLTMMLSLGLVFETPLILMLLARMGIVNSRLLSRFRRHIYVGIFVVSAMLTPPDPFTMIALSVPLIALFEASIWLIKPIERRRLVA